MGGFEALQSGEDGDDMETFLETQLEKSGEVGSFRVTGIAF